MTDRQRLLCALELLSGDIAGEADVIDSEGKGFTERELYFANLIMRLYRLIHPCGDCKNPHEDWKSENEKLFRKLDKWHCGKCDGGIIPFHGKRCVKR